MTILYVFDTEGDFASPDGLNRYKRYIGVNVYAFFKATETNKRHFVLISEDEDPDEIWIEVHEDEVYIARKDRRRQQYISDVIADTGWQFVSMNAQIDRNSTCESMVFEEIISDQSEDLVDTISNQKDLAILHDALKHLKKDELELVKALYLDPDTVSEEEYGARLNLSQQAISMRKKRILKKLKKFFDLTL